MRTLLILLAAAALLAGCADDSGLDADGASLEFEGRGSGSHEDSADCDDDATLAGSGNVEDGSIEVTVTDGSGAVKFEESFDGGIESEAERMQGASGDWTLSIVRAGDDLIGDEFNGQYAFTLTC